MQPKDGADYAQNYDIIVKWLAPALCGHTLDAIGVKTGVIEDVFGFEPANISVRTGRVDVMARDENGDLYHIEEQRDLKIHDMYRFASYHWTGAGQFGREITDVILSSGDTYKGEKIIETGSSKYAPVIIDFTDRDGPKRLTEIRAAIKEGTFENWLELIFLPLYGKEKGGARSKLVEAVIRLGSELVRARKISSTFLAATLIMSNKLISKERINKLWEEIKMLDVLDVAMEKGENIGIEKGKIIGIEEGKSIGIAKGSLNKTRKMLLSALTERFGIIPSRISGRIDEIDRESDLDALFLQIFRCDTIAGFEEMLQRLDL